MNRRVLTNRVAILYVYGAILLLATRQLSAEQEVTLKSGASLIGNVSFDGDQVVVEIDDSKMRVPLQEVDTIASVDASHQRQARRMLLTALEAKLAKDTGTEVIGLLAEAARLAPDDPHIAYWYATCLADAGFGKAADDVLRERRELIAKSYPGLIDQLAARVKRRVAMENMPAALIERIDAINATVKQQSTGNDMLQLWAIFRLADQDDRGIDRSAFQIQSNGQEDNLEEFDDGYFLLTFKQHRSNNNQPCQLEVAQPGLESKSFQFSGGTNRVRDAGTFVVRRFDETAKTPFRARLVDADSKPVSGALVTLQAMSPRGGTTDNVLSTEADAEGRAEILAFPMKYVYRVQVDGFNHDSGNIELKPDAANVSEKQIALYAAIQATVRVEWTSASFQGGGKTSGEATLQVAGGPPQPYQHHQDTTSWIRPLQLKDRLTLQITGNPYGYGGPYGAREPWVRVIEPAVGPEEGQDVEAALENFSNLNLDKIDDLKNELRAPRTIAAGNQPGHPHTPMVVAAELGKIYVGKVQGRDMRTGQPTHLAFKAIVEEMTTEGAAEE